MELKMILNSFSLGLFSLVWSRNVSIYCCDNASLGCILTILYLTKETHAGYFKT